MTTLAAHTGYFTGRKLRALARQPAFVVILLIQPMIWLLLFGELFKRVVELPGSPRVRTSTSSRPASW